MLILNPTNMKTFILSCFLACSFIPVTAQNFRVGAIIGPNINAPKGLDSRVGGNIGVKGEMYISKNKTWYSEASLLLSLQNWEYGPYEFEEHKSYHWVGSPYYLKIPLHVGYKWSIGNDRTVYVNAGPYVSFGIFGNLKTEIAQGGTTAKTETTNHNIFENGAPAGDAKQGRFDYGLGASIGTDITEHLQISIGYDHGFKHLYQGWYHSTMNMYSLSIAYMF
jgi:hypothetical protein